MKKFDYSFRALVPIQSFGDENVGQLRKLRREKRLLLQPEVIPSKFSSEEERENAIINLLQNIWKSFAFELDSKRILSIYDEFHAKLVNATYCKTKKQFLNRLCESFDIKSLSDEHLLEILDKFHDDELLNIIRDQSQYLVLKFRVQKENKEQKFLFSSDEGSDVINFVKYYENIPYIAGNSIRGYLRRLIMRDFCFHTGITKINKELYHQLFTGGNITDSSGMENIEKREEFISMCPAIGLLGSAIGSQTIQGELKVMGARLRCVENGTGKLSYWNLIENKFSTRLDSSKQENDIEIVSGEKSKNKTANQMIFWNESFITGSEFDSSLIVTTKNELLLSCFVRIVELFKENNFVGGNSARDAGMIDINLTINDLSSMFYIKHLEENKEQIQKYFEGR